jgi:hypothetical protein
VSYVVSLRGKEGLLLDLEGLHQHASTGDGSYVVITLQGTVKGESNDRDHLLPYVPSTLSDVHVKVSLKRLMEHELKLGFVDGPAISDMVFDQGYVGLALGDIGRFVQFKLILFPILL